MRNSVKLVSALLTATALASISPFASAAADCHVSSPPQTVAVVELYTSEGCSSCPPADRWLAELARRFTAEQVLPLALHVDYWDELGWPDAFAQVKFAQRQQRLSQLSKAGTIYTPEVFTAMKEIRDWRNDETFARRVETINRQPARASIELSSHGDAGTAVLSRDIEVHFALKTKDAAAMADARGIVLIFEKNLSTAVRAGENRGARLEHTQVVRYWSPPIEIDGVSGEANWRQKIPLPAGWKRQDLGVAALIESPASGEILQAVMLPGCV